MAKSNASSSQATSLAGSKEEQAGFHKGSLTVLAKEREELLRIVSIVEQLMQMHLKGLKELGVDLEAEAKAAKKSRPPLEAQLAKE